MRRWNQVLGLALTAALLASAPAGAAGKDAGARCKKGGWQRLVTTTGDGFLGQDSCVSYAVHGGKLYPALSITEFAVPPFGGEAQNRASAWGITQGPDGNVWFKDTQNFNRTGFITASGAITFQNNYLPYEHEIVAGADGNLWSHGNPGGGTLTARAPGGSHVEFDLSVSASYTLALAWGPDGNLWLATYDGLVVKQAPDPLASATGYPLPAGRCDAITAGPDGNLWCANQADSIDRITPSGTVTQFALPHSGTMGSLETITTGPDGNIWFTEDAGNRIGRITPSGSITEFNVPTAGARPTGIAAGPDGNVWFTLYGGSRIGRATPSGEINEYVIPSGASALRIAAGPGGTLWFTEGDKIGRVAP